MTRVLRVLLAVALACPASAWAAGNVRSTTGRASPIPSLPASLPALAAPGQASAVVAPATTGAIPGAAPAAPLSAQPAKPAAGESAVGQLQAGAAGGASESGDESQKYSADQAFDNLRAEKSDENAAPEAALVKPTPPRGRPRQPPTPSPEADDGGGPDYPSANVRFGGQLFRATLFRPNTPVEPEIIRAIDTAKKSIQLALFEFGSTGILDALRRARARGVEIHIVLDYSHVFPMADPGSDYKPKRSREIWALLRENFDVTVLRGISEFGINHNKFAVIDHGQKQTLSIFGSYNWTWTAEHSHYENANFDTDKKRADALKLYWDWLRSMAQPEPQARDYAWPQTVPSPPVSIAVTLAFNDIVLPPLVLSPNKTPGQSIEDRLVQAIDAARKSIDVSIFALRSTKIAEALARAHNDPKRKVKVRLIMDEDQSTSVPFGPYAQWLAAQGVSLRVLSGPDPKSDFPLAQKDHHKFAVFDGKLVETGSPNYTKYAAGANFENAHFLDRDTTVEGYSWIFERMFKRAKAFAAPAQAPALPTDAELEAELQKPPRPAPTPEPPPAPNPSVKPRKIMFNAEAFDSYAFRPDTPIEPIIVRAIQRAQKSVRIALYEFNLENVMEALRDAKKRKLKVEVVIDHSHVYTRGKDHTGQPRKPSPQILALINEEFDILTLKGKNSGIMHNKYLLLDAEDAAPGKEGGLVMFGSYNFAQTAERNHFENTRFSVDGYDTTDFLRYFNYKRELASPVDRDKLEETLARTSDAGLEPEDAVAPENEDWMPEALSRAAGDARDSKFPEPPRSTAPMLEFNGEKFHRRYFSPQGGILDAWLRAIRAAKASVEILMFGFYARDVAEAIVEKAQEFQKAGKEFAVRGVFDAGQSSLAKIDDIPILEWFAQRGVKMLRIGGPNENGDPMFEKQHNKLMLVDGKLLLTGSFNVSPTAENHSFENENLTLDPADVAGYVEYFARLHAEAQRRAGVAKAWAQAIASAGKTIDLAVFQEWPYSIGDLLLEAKRAKPELKMRVLLGKQQAASSHINGVPVLEWLSRHGFESAVSEPTPEFEEILAAAGGRFAVVADGHLTLTASALEDSAAGHSPLASAFERAYQAARQHIP